jgi:hypothetical protein
MSYKFTLERPPLLSKSEHDGNVLAIRPSTLESRYGPGKWETFTRKKMLLALFAHGWHAYDATRILRWELDGPVTHYPNNRERVIKKTIGYDKTVMNKFTSSLGLKGEVKTEMFSSSIELKLGFEETVTQKWTSERVEQFKETFQAGYTYVDWVLVEEILVRRISRIGIGKKNRRGVEWSKPTSRVNRSVSTILAYRTEKFPTEGGGEDVVVSELPVSLDIVAIGDIENLAGIEVLERGFPTFIEAELEIERLSRESPEITYTLIDRNEI